jgi:Protein of unknown function (DUF2867)
MPQISPTEFYALPLRVHTFLADVPLHDVWAVDLPTHRDGVTLSEFLRRASHGGTNRLPPVARALVRLRLFLGRIFRLEAEPRDALAASFGSRLTPEDRARSLAVSGTKEGLFRVVYRFENEQLVEMQNRTVHAAALSALAERADSYRFYFAVYVRQRTWITPFYMGLIDPFRKWIIYPAMLKTIRATWDQISDFVAPGGTGPERSEAGHAARTSGAAKIKS